MIEKYAYLIIDPFDFTYNPAKHVLIGDNLHKEYIFAMDKAIESLIE